MSAVDHRPQIIEPTRALADLVDWCESHGESPTITELRVVLDLLGSQESRAYTAKDAPLLAVDAIRDLCDEQEAWCSANRLDLPSWVASVRERLALAD
jgi:hypothetical protein